MAFGQVWGCKSDAETLALGVCTAVGLSRVMDAKRSAISCVYTSIANGQGLCG